MLKYRNCFLIIGKSVKKCCENEFPTRCYSVCSGNHTVDLSYVSYETAPKMGEEPDPLIVLHGLMGCKTNWTAMSKAIHKNTGRKVIAVDARNHGDSPHTDQHSYSLMASDVETLMGKLNVKQACVMGHSMGGRTAMLLGLLKPDLVSSLIIGDISPVRTSPNIFSMESIFAAMVAVQIQPGLSLGQARKLADMQLAATVPDVGMRAFIVTNLALKDAGDYAWRVNLPTLRKLFRDKIAQFTDMDKDLVYNGPTLFLAGGMSDYIDPSDLPAIQVHFPKAELTVLPGAGHWIHSQKPELFLKLVCNFLKDKS